MSTLYGIRRGTRFHSPALALHGCSSVRRQARATIRLGLCALVLLPGLMQAAQASQALQAPDVRQMQALLAHPSPQPLLEHIAMLVHQGRIDRLGSELSALRHGHAPQIHSVEFLSRFSSDDRGVQHFANAVALGRWLGATQLVLERENASRSKQARYYSELLAATANATGGQHREHYERLANGGIQQRIAVGKLQLGSAVKLIGFGDVTSSGVTVPVGQALNKVYHSGIR